MMSRKAMAAYNRFKLIAPFFWVERYNVIVLLRGAGHQEDIFQTVPRFFEQFFKLLLAHLAKLKPLLNDLSVVHHQDGRRRIFHLDAGALWAERLKGRLFDDGELAVGFGKDELHLPQVEDAVGAQLLHQVVDRIAQVAELLLVDSAVLNQHPGVAPDQLAQAGTFEGADRKNNLKAHQGQDGDDTQNQRHVAVFDRQSCPLHQRLTIILLLTKYKYIYEKIWILFIRSLRTNCL